MQRDAKGDIIFWRGEKRNGKMEGTLRKRSVKGESEEVPFTSTSYYKIVE
jgi:hypothetical protein